MEQIILAQRDAIAQRKGPPLDRFAVSHLGTKRESWIAVLQDAVWHINTPVLDVAIPWLLRARRRQVRSPARSCKSQ